MNPGGLRNGRPLTAQEKTILAWHLADLNPAQERQERRCELKAILVADAIIFGALGLLWWAARRPW